MPFTAPPSSTGSLTRFEAPTNVADNYGQRVRGYLTAPTTGSYTFWVAGDNNCELWLSTNNQASNKVKIAYHTDWDLQPPLEDLFHAEERSHQITGGAAVLHRSSDEGRRWQRLFGCGLG
jgi:photosystem II stability/assembly factor-like uncharacterized protein